MILLWAGTSAPVKRSACRVFEEFVIVFVRSAPGDFLLSRAVLAQSRTTKRIPLMK
jgi:hypothetical protein